METQQINLKIPLNLLMAARNYAQNFGYRNLQDLATECMREKVFEQNEFDETFNEKEINLIDDLISISIKKRTFSNEEELNSILLK